MDWKYAKESNFRMTWVSYQHLCGGTEQSRWSH